MSHVEKSYPFAFRLMARAKLPAAVSLLGAAGFGLGFSLLPGPMMLYPGFLFVAWVVMLAATLWYAWACMQQAVLDRRNPPPRTRFRVSYLLWLVFLAIVPSFLSLAVSMLLLAVFGLSAFSFLASGSSPGAASVFGLFFAQIASVVAMCVIMIGFQALYGTVLPANILQRSTGLGAAYRRGKQQFGTLVRQLLFGPVLTCVVLSMVMGLVGVAVFGMTLATTGASGDLFVSMRSLAIFMSVVGALVALFVFAQYCEIMARAYWRAEDADGNTLAGGKATKSSPQPT